MIIAHGIGGRADLPIPLPLLLGGAAAVLVFTFLALAVLWPQPRFQDGPRYDGPGSFLPTQSVLTVLGVTALLLVVGQLLPDLLGAEMESTRSSIAPVMVWVVFWLVVPFAGAVLGDWYTGLNPWRSLAISFGIGKGERIGLVKTLGVWPATVVFLAFVWMELISPESGDPLTLGLAAAIYTLFLLMVMVFLGRETTLATVDAFTPYNRLISAISPLGRNREGRVVWRGWLRSLTVIPEWPGLWVFVVAMIGTVSFDGASGTEWLRSVAGSLVDTSTGRTVLLLASVALIAAAYLGASAVSARLGGGDWTTGRVAQRFAHSLVPIALAYATAHYFTLILFEGQQLLAALSDPFALGWDLFRTADWRVNYFITSSTPIWLLQVAFIVGGHLVGVVLAHDRSLRDFGREAVRSQYAMLVLMIALTSLGLLILSG